MKQSAMNWRHAPTSSTNSWTVDVKELAGESPRAILATAPGNGELIGALNVVTDDGWLAARPSGTDVYTLTRNVCAS
jgi:phosphoglucomutase